MRLSLWTTVWLAATQVGAQPREPHRYFKDVIGSILKSQAIKRAREGVAGVLANGKKNLEAGYKESE